MVTWAPIKLVILKIEIPHSFCFEFVFGSDKESKSVKGHAQKNIFSIKLVSLRNYEWALGVYTYLHNFMSIGIHHLREPENQRPYEVPLIVGLQCHEQKDNIVNSWK